jgi:hypothetical protein
MPCTADSHNLQSGVRSSDFCPCQHGQHCLPDSVRMPSWPGRQHRWHPNNSCAGNRLDSRDNHQRLCIRSWFSHRQRLRRQRHPHQHRISIIDDWKQWSGGYVPDWSHHYQQRWCCSHQLPLHGAVDCPRADCDWSCSSTNRRRIFDRLHRQDNLRLCHRSHRGTSPDDYHQDCDQYPNHNTDGARYNHGRHSQHNPDRVCNSSDQRSAYNRDRPGRYFYA